MIDRIPSERLLGMLKDCCQSYEGTAIKIMACYKQAISEGYDKWQARRLIEEMVGLSDRQIRHYLPAEAKDMQFNRAKPKTAEVASAVSQSPTKASVEATSEDRLKVDREWHERIVSCIARNQAFNIVIKNRRIVGVEAVIAYDGDCGNDPILLERYDVN